MRIYNTKTRQKEEFRPIEPKKVSMYVCGPTVYDQIHIGNARTFVAFDMIRRYLAYKGYDVTFVQNLTDVDDKIIGRAREEHTTAEAIATTYSDAFIEQMHRLGIEDPTIRPRATQEIEAMQHMIAELIERGHAYVADNGDVYFAVRGDAAYGTVSGRRIDELMVGARIEENQDKRDPLDFVLWKASKSGEPAWDSPWGPGRPGWHTECVAMIKRYLGAPIDIHGGGSDLVFPHHENENAQAQMCFDTPLAHVWMHTGMLLVEGEKMSKSLGNFYTLKEVLNKYSANAVRLLMFQTHYRSPLDFSFERLEGAEKLIQRIEKTIQRAKWELSRGDATTSASLNLEDAAAQTRERFVAAMDDDFNTSVALASLFNLVDLVAQAVEDQTNTGMQQAISTLTELFGVLGIRIAEDEQALPQELIPLAQRFCETEAKTPQEAAEMLIQRRQQARSEKDWATADAIRDEIAHVGVVLEDTQGETRIVMN